jgi:hypothetical protein
MVVPMYLNISSDEKLKVLEKIVLMLEVLQAGKLLQLT